MLAQRRLLPLFALLVVALVGVVSCAGSPVYRWKDENAIGYRVGPGDKLRVAVWKHEEVSQEATVRPDGAFSLPLVGDVAATGRSAQEIAADIQTHLAKYYTDNPPVTVQVTEVRSYKIYVLGEVQHPGELAPTHEVTVLMGLAMAGGFTRFASPNQIVIVRHDARGERRIPFDYGAVVEHGDVQQNVILQLGDTVIVPLPSEAFASFVFRFVTRLLACRPTEVISLCVPAELRYRDVATRVVSAACKLVGQGTPSSPPGSASKSDFHEHVVSAFGEAFNNVILHAYGNNSADEKTVTVEIDVESDRIEIRVLDFGKAFVPDEVPPPDLEGLPESGMGLFIIRSFMDDVQYEPGSPNVLRLAKCL